MRNRFVAVHTEVSEDSDSHSHAYPKRSSFSSFGSDSFFYWQWWRWHMQWRRRWWRQWGWWWRGRRQFWIRPVVDASMTYSVGRSYLQDAEMAQLQMHVLTSLSTVVSLKLRPFYNRAFDIKKWWNRCFEKSDAWLVWTSGKVLHPYS